MLAGGQSLVPLLSFRLVRPAYIVDLNEVDGLAGMRLDDGHLAIGAMTRQRAVETSPLVRQWCPLLAEAMPQIGHVQIRNRGTVGGSLAHADPASELTAVVAALDGELVLRSARGQRVLKPEQFFVAYLTTVVTAPDPPADEPSQPPSPPSPPDWRSRLLVTLVLLVTAAVAAVMIATVIPPGGETRLPDTSDPPTVAGTSRPPSSSP